jgi:hypothetical protein
MAKQSPSPLLLSLVKHIRYHRGCCCLLCPSHVTMLFLKLCLMLPMVCVQQECVVFLKNDPFEFVSHQ